MFPSIFTVKLSNCEHLKNFRNVDCVLANQYKVQDYYASKPQNHKLITVAVCGLVNSHLIGLFLETQWHSINVSGVHAFVSFTVRVIWNSQNRAGATYFPQLLPTWPPATDIGKQEKKWNQKKSPAVWFPAYLLYLPGNLNSWWQPWSKAFRTKVLLTDDWKYWPMEYSRGFNNDWSSQHAWIG